MTPRGFVLLDNGQQAYREVVEHPSGACVLPFTGNAFILVRQYRIAHQNTLEAPPANSSRRIPMNARERNYARKPVTGKDAWFPGKRVSFGRLLQ